MYKKIIKRGENEYTYYYTNIRKEGKVKNIFLSSEHEICIKIVDKKYNIYNSSFSNLLINSAVVNTLTNDCCLKCLSLDQIWELSDNASARKSISSESDITSDDFLRRYLYSESFLKSILDSTSNCLISNSCSDNPDLNKQSFLYLLNSDFINYGAINFTLSEENIYELIEFGFIRENNMLLSNTNFIFYLSSSFLSSGESSDNNLLNLPSFAFLPHSTDHLMTSCSSFDSSFLESSFSFIFFNKSILSISDQFTHGNFFISSLTSSGIANVTDAIYISPFSTISENFFNCLTLRMVISLNTSDHLTSGNLSISFFNSSGIDSVTVAMLVPPFNYVNKHNYVDVYKSFDGVSNV